MTETMRAVVIDSLGPPDVLRVAELPIPRPAEGEVLVRVRAAGVNAIDWDSRAGNGVPITAFPAILGWDVFGVVDATGPGVTGMAVGDTVFGMPRFPALADGYAEFVAAPATELAVLPGSVDPHAAAGAPLITLTAWQTLFRHAELQAGQRVLVHGAAGGVGHVAVQLAKRAGAEVFATASARNHAFLKELGADRVIDYTTTAPEDVLDDMDVAIDPRGGEDFHRLTRTLRRGGIIVTLKGTPPGGAETAAARGIRIGRTYVQPDGAALAEIAPLLADGSLRIAVERVFPLADVAAAHRIGHEGHVRGRLVLDVPA